VRSSLFRGQAELGDVVGEELGFLVGGEVPPRGVGLLGPAGVEAAAVRGRTRRAVARPGLGLRYPDQ